VFIKKNTARLPLFKNGNSSFINNARDLHFHITTANNNNNIKLIRTDASKPAAGEFTSAGI